MMKSEMMCSRATQFTSDLRAEFTLLKILIRLFAVDKSTVSNYNITRFEIVIQRGPLKNHALGT